MPVVTGCLGEVLASMSCGVHDARSVYHVGLSSHLPAACSRDHAQLPEIPPNMRYRVETAVWRAIGMRSCDH